MRMRRPLGIKCLIDKHHAEKVSAVRSVAWRSARKPSNRARR